jgi:hypothetical protein
MRRTVLLEVELGLEELETFTGLINEAEEEGDIETVCVRHISTSKEEWTDIVGLLRWTIGIRQKKLEALRKIHSNSELSWQEMHVAAWEILNEDDEGDEL